jgi:hypothetical protein
VSSTALVLALLQQRPELPDWASKLLQFAIVVIFLILPAIKSRLEQKRRAGQSKPTEPTQRRRAELEREGGDLWRELMRGERTAAPPRPPAQAPARPSPRPPPARQVATRSTSAEIDPDLERRPLRVDPETDDALHELHRQRSAEAERRRTQRAAELERSQADRAVERGRAASQALGGLDVRVESSRLEPGVAPAVLADPATIDDEIGRRWGATSQAQHGSEARAALLSGDMDLRRAVLLSELLAPPLALRGQTAAWPGPPSALAS